MLVGSQGKRAMTVHPAVGVGLAPGGLLIDATQSLGNNAQILLFLVPDRSFGFVHHLVGTDNPVFTQAQEIAEK
jgi:hypothetical protein